MNSNLSDNQALRFIPLLENVIALPFEREHECFSNGSGVKEVAPAPMFNFSTKLQGAISLTPCYMKCFFGRGKKKLNFLF